MASFTTSVDSFGNFERPAGGRPLVAVERQQCDCRTGRSENVRKTVFRAALDRLRKHNALTTTVVRDRACVVGISKRTRVRSLWNLSSKTFWIYFGDKVLVRVWAFFFFKLGLSGSRDKRGKSSHLTTGTAFAGMNWPPPRVSSRA